MKHDIGILWAMLLVMLMNCGCAKRVAAPFPTAQGSASFCEAGQIRLSEILIRASQPDDPAQLAAAQQEAERVRDDVRRGGVFADLARANSQGPTAAQGGDIGCFRHGQLSQSLENLLSRMKIGDVSDVLRTEQGFVILQVTDHKDGSLGSRNIDLLLPALFKRSGIKRGEDESSVTFVEDGQLTAGERG